MTERRDNSGTMGRNSRKEKDTHPDFDGEAIIDGKPYWVNAWVKEGRNGKFFSMSFKPKQKPNQPRREDPIQRDDDDRIPF